jgi:hypothetical protein
VLCNGPNAEVSEELREGGGQVVGVEATGVGKNPGVAAAEKGLLEADAGVFDTGDDAVRMNADKGDDGRAPASDFSLEAPAAGAKFVVGEFIRAGGGAFDDVGDAEPKVEKKRSLKGGKKARSESAVVKSGPEAIARAAEVAADGGGVEAGVDAREEDDEVFGRKIRDDLVTRGENLGFAGFPGNDQCPMHRAASSKGILRQSEDCSEAISGRRESHLPVAAKVTVRPGIKRGRSYYDFNCASVLSPSQNAIGMSSRATPPGRRILPLAEVQSAGFASAIEPIAHHSFRQARQQCR